jgi:hypothetical protein
VRFDAYAGNVPGVRPDQVAELLSFGVKGRVVRGKPRGRYGDVWEVGNLPADGSVWVGHDRQLEASYFEVKGATTPPAVDLLRRNFPGSHTVSRMDSCEDYNDPAAYSKLVRLVDLACDPRVKSHAWQPRNDEEAGATTYWGSPQSRVMVRAYEAGKMPDRLHYGKPDWARVEAQIRPGKGREKAHASSVSALDAWGFAAWSKRAAERLAQVEVERFAPQADAPSFDKTTLYVARAFRRHWEEMLADFGDWHCIGKELEEVWRLDDEAKV